MSSHNHITMHHSIWILPQSRYSYNAVHLRGASRYHVDKASHRTAFYARDMYVAVPIFRPPPQNPTSRQLLSLVSSLLSNPVVLVVGSLNLRVTMKYISLPQQVFKLHPKVLTEPQVQCCMWNAGGPYCCGTEAFELVVRENFKSILVRTRFPVSLWLRLFNTELACYYCSYLEQRVLIVHHHSLVGTCKYTHVGYQGLNMSWQFFTQNMQHKWEHCGGKWEI